MQVKVTKISKKLILQRQKRKNNLCLIYDRHITKGRFADAPARPSYSRSSQHSVPAPMHMGSLHGSTVTHSAPIPVPPPSQYYQVTAGTSGHLPSSAVPSTSSHPHSHSNSVGSIRLSDLQFGGTPSGVSNPPTLVHPLALVPQPKDRDLYRRWYIIPYGVRFKPMQKLEKITNKCVTRHWNSYWTNWQKVPENEREKMFKEFHKYYWWDEAHEKMEKKLGRKVRQDEVFEETHVRKKKNPTDEDVLVEPRTKATHDKYMQLVNEYHSTQLPESQGDTIPEEVEEELWKETMGPPVRGQYYGYHIKYFSKNVRFSFGPTSYSSSVDRETVESLKNTVSKLTEELTA
ncbi:hypothetical protein P3L10_032160 [Capsicum annuum]